MPPLTTVPTSAPTAHHAFIRRGRFKGALLLPVIKTGTFVLSTSKHAKDYTLHPISKPLEPMFALGYGMRMYSPDHAGDHPPSFILAASIRGRLAET